MSRGLGDVYKRQGAACTDTPMLACAAFDPENNDDSTTTTITATTETTTAGGVDPATASGSTATTAGGSEPTGTTTAASGNTDPNDPTKPGGSKGHSASNGNPSGNTGGTAAAGGSSAAGDGSAARQHAGTHVTATGDASMDPCAQIVNATCQSCTLHSAHSCVFCASERKCVSGGSWLGVVDKSKSQIDNAQDALFGERCVDWQFGQCWLQGRMLLFVLAGTSVALLCCCVCVCVCCICKCRRKRKQTSGYSRLLEDSPDDDVPLMSGVRDETVI
eukprot:TRINITY_DN4066_c0_g1_i1.p1 TRINITY_DN4066_c0_g1~~TRINITY_DN4066_c0_g1_i1.p1  ORF type:complete len:276 (+),score=101.64 TRINITY_DN4066_c0_g1_i1:2-829(+)